MHPDLVGSSLLREREGEHVDGVPRSVTVDDRRRPRARARAWNRRSCSRSTCRAPSERSSPGRRDARPGGGGDLRSVVLRLLRRRDGVRGAAARRWRRRPSSSTTSATSRGDPSTAPSRRPTCSSCRRAARRAARARLRGPRPARRADRGVRRDDPAPDRPRALTWPTCPSHLGRHPGAEPGPVGRGDAALRARRLDRSGRVRRARRWLRPTAPPRRSSATTNG